MIPPIFTLLAQNASVKAVLGDPLRVFSFGEVEGQPVQTPYLVWQQVAGTPFNYITDVPDLDNPTTQLDVYATGRTEARDVFRAVRDVLEKEAKLVNGPTESREAETKLFRVSFDLDWVIDH